MFATNSSSQVQSVHPCTGLLKSLLGGLYKERKPSCDDQDGSAARGSAPISWLLSWSRPQTRISPIYQVSEYDVPYTFYIGDSAQQRRPCPTICSLSLAGKSGEASYQLSSLIARNQEAPLECLKSLEVRRRDFYRHDSSHDSG